MLLQKAVTAQFWRGSAPGLDVGLRVMTERAGTLLEQAATGFTDARSTMQVERACARQVDHLFQRLLFVRQDLYYQM